MDETYLTIKELCAHWKVTRNTLLNLRNRKIGPQPVQLFPGQRGLRYRRSEVEAYDQGRRSAQPNREGA